MLHNLMITLSPVMNKMNYLLSSTIIINSNILTIPTNGKEKTGYPTQKPLGIIRRIVAASSNPGDLVLDFFAGSGTTGMVCHELGRDFILVDSNPQAIETMKLRFDGLYGIEWVIPEIDQ